MRSDPAGMHDWSHGRAACRFFLCALERSGPHTLATIEIVVGAASHCGRTLARWSGPLTLLQKSHEYLKNGNVTAASRVLTALEQTPFLSSEVEALKGKLSTWM